MITLANNLLNVVNTNSGTAKNAKSAMIPAKPAKTKISNAQVAMTVMNS